MKPTWSCTIIARNEEKTLPRLAESLKEFLSLGGEWIVVDTGSTDNTVDVAVKAGATVYQVGDRFRVKVTDEEARDINALFVVEGEAPVIAGGDSLFDYSSARNYAASLAANDFVWMPDADEAFTKFNLEKIESALNGADRLEYEFIFAHDQEGNPSIRFRHSKAYNREKFHWKGIVHEVLQGEGRTVYIGEEHVLLEHFQNAATDRSGYLRGLSLDCFRDPANDRNSHYLGREFAWTGRPKSAIKELQRHIAMNRWPAERAQSAVFIGDSCEMIGDEDEAYRWWNWAYKIDPTRREPFLKLAAHFFRKGDAMRTAAYATAALTIPRSGFYADNEEHYRHVPSEMLAWALWQTGSKREAKEHWQRWRGFQPRNSKMLFDARFHMELPMVSFLVPQLGRPEGLERCLNSIKNLNYPPEKIEVIVDDREEPTVPEKVEDMRVKAKGEFYFFLANDTEIMPDALIHAVLTAEESGKGMVAADSGRPNESEHFLISRDLVKKLEDGMIFHKDFFHVACDNWLKAQAEKIGEFAWCMDAKVTHHHFTKDAAYDWVYARGWENADRDREILKKKIEKLHA